MQTMKNDSKKLTFLFAIVFLYRSSFVMNFDYSFEGLHV